MSITLNRLASFVLTLAVVCLFSSSTFAGVSRPPTDPGLGCGESYSDGCGLEIKVRCNSDDNNLFGGNGLEVFEQWVFEYDFTYDSDPVCDSDGEAVFADTNKMELKCTDVLKGNGKSGNKITVEMEMKFDESKACS